MRVGGSVWELKIDPKRSRKKIKNDIEKRRKKNSDKKSIKSAKKSAFGPARETSPPKATFWLPAVGSGRERSGAVDGRGVAPVGG